MTQLNRESVLKTLRGFEEVNRITEAERRERLANMTDEEARAIFDDLNQSIEELTPEEKKRLELFRLEHHLKVRKAMAKMGKARV
ncbi:MAG: hypothetical protein B5M51_09405 [Anaerolinea sp. 4484_236]|nr:MAG: hypothetical protein B5M51_09405 [Anaerolinea sp. 4484_236]RLD11396.1 MAG: hypothetical protein DRI56_01065 [Chloroflexota bacterium]